MLKPLFNIKLSFVYVMDEKTQECISYYLDCIQLRQVILAQFYGGDI